MPKILRPSIWKQVFLIILFLIVFATHSVGAMSSSRLVQLTNQQRSQHQLIELKENPLLTDSATKKAEHMCSIDYWAHTAPGGKQPWQFMREAGYEYENAGENLAKGFLSEESTVAAWMASPSHKANIMHLEFTEIGVAQTRCRLQGAEVNLVVAHYGRPKNKPKQTYSVANFSTIEASLTIYHALSSIQAHGLLISKL